MKTGICRVCGDKLVWDNTAAGIGSSVYDRVESILAALPEDASEMVRRSATDLLSGMLEEYLAARLGLGGVSV